MEHIIKLGESLKETEVKLKDVINDLEDDDNFMQMGEKKESLIHLIDQIQELNESICHKRREMTKGRCSEETRKALNARIREDQGKILSVVSSFSLEKRQLENMLESFRELLDTVETAEKDVAECMLQAGWKADFLSETVHCSNP